MKKIALIATLLVMVNGVWAQGKINTYKHAYIWGQSNRNAGTKGSCLSTKDGLTYSLQNVIKKATPKAIDIMCAYGKIEKGAENGFCLFAPENPSIEIDWAKTIPYRYFEASQHDAGGNSALKNWKVRNATKIQVIPAIDFDNATYETLAGLELGDHYIAGNLEEGSIIAFETATTSNNPGKKGLIKITKIEDDERDDKAGTGAFQRLNLLIKVQR
jgi:hypothetical protein